MDEAALWGLYSRIPPEGGKGYAHTTLPNRRLLKVVKTTRSGWNTFSRSIVPYAIALNCLGAIAHGVGVGITLSRGRWNIALDTYQSKPVNYGNNTHPVVRRVQEATGQVYPTQVVFAFFVLSLTFHTFITIVLLLSLAFPSSTWFSWYLRGLWSNIAPWVRSPG